MRKKFFVPCACNVRFFCNINKTNGMERKTKPRKEAKKKQDEKVCTIERVDLGRGGTYCRPCYRKRSDMNENNSKRRKGCSVPE